MTSKWPLNSNDAYFVVLIMLLVPKKEDEDKDDGEEIVEGPVRVADDE